MRKALELLGKLSLMGFGVIGLLDETSMSNTIALALLIPGSVLVGLLLLSVTFVKADQFWPSDDATPRPIRIRPVDYAKAFVAWLHGFRRTYAVAPGLYYTGDHYDLDTPLLVTANYHLSVFLVTRRVRAANARLLVIDTDGINVWCAAGKGRFGNEQILSQIDRYPRKLLTAKIHLSLVLPKFGMSGVDLHALRQYGLAPVVGPLYAKDLPDYLSTPPLRHRRVDRVHFGLQSRVFILLPGLIQLTALSALLTAAISLVGYPLGAPIQLGVIGVVTTLGVAYPLLFPLIPARRFAIKGLLLALVIVTVLLSMAFLGAVSLLSMWFAVPFTLAAGILVGLEFTGNSAVSNYSRVKREIVLFIPISALMLVCSLTAFITVEVLR